MHARKHIWGWGGRQSEQQNLKVIIKKYGSLSRLTYPTECLHSMLVISHFHEDLLREPTLVAGPPKKAYVNIIDKNFQMHTGENIFSKLLILAFIYKAMLIYKCSRITWCRYICFCNWSRTVHVKHTGNFQMFLNDLIIYISII